jgi:hypothetical protein
MLTTLEGLCHAQAELGECQQALRTAKAESGRRLKELTALQQQVADEGGRAAAGAALEEERRTREAAEAQLREARQGLARKVAMVKELRSKVGGDSFCFCFSTGAWDALV